MMRLIIPERNIISDAVQYISVKNRTEVELRTWFNSQNYAQDYHYFETRLMTRPQVMKNITSMGDVVFSYND